MVGPAPPESGSPARRRPITVSGRAAKSDDHVGRGAEEGCTLNGRKADGLTVGFESEPRPSGQRRPSGDWCREGGPLAQGLRTPRYMGK
jgi:hypothetical protein